MASERIFSNLTAWFSASVCRRRCRMWAEMGGKVTNLDQAQFVFSQNAESEDTKRIFESEPYINEHLAVFHAMYISDCVQSGDAKQIPVGKYFLPPQQITELVHNQITFPWEDGDESSSSVSDEEMPKKSSQGQQKQNRAKKSSNSPCSPPNKITNRTSIQVNSHDSLEVQQKSNRPNSQELKRSCADKSDSVGRQETTCRAANSRSNNCHRLCEQSSLQKGPGTSVDTNTASYERTSQTPDSSRRAQKRLESQEPDIMDIETLPKVIGDLEDFIPGCNGFSVFLKK